MAGEDWKQEKELGEQLNDENKPMLSPMTIERMLQMATDPYYNLNPMDRAIMNAVAKNYGNGKQSTGFSKRYDKYYSPFLAGVGATKQKDLIPNVYKGTSPFDDEGKMYRHMKFNKGIDRYSQIDPYLTSAAKGLGVMTAMGGTMPAVALGLGISKGVPAAWHLAKQYMARRYAKNKEKNRYYKKLLEAHPTI
jgi:hypothetical protein